MTKTKFKIANIICAIMLLVAAVLFSACDNADNKTLDAQQMIDTYQTALNKTINLDTLSVKMTMSGIGEQGFNSATQTMLFSQDKAYICFATNGQLDIEMWYEIESNGYYYRYEHEPGSNSDRYDRYDCSLSDGLGVENFIELVLFDGFLDDAGVALVSSNNPVMTKQANGKILFSYTVTDEDMGEINKKIVLGADGLIEKIEWQYTEYNMSTIMEFECNQTVQIPTRPENDGNINWQEH